MVSGHTKSFFELESRAFRLLWLIQRKICSKYPGSVKTPSTIFDWDLSGLPHGLWLVSIHKTENGKPFVDAVQKRRVLIPPKSISKKVSML